MGPHVAREAYHGEFETGYVSPVGAALPRAITRLQKAESAEDYPAVVAVLDAKTRVIECNAGIQWIVQRKGGRQWHGESFCRTRDALRRCVGRHRQHPALLALPAWFPEGSK
jgi:hypothetical protein